MKVAGIQADLVWEDPEANFRRLAPRIEEAAGEGARLVVLPEMFSTGFSMRAEQVAEPPGGPGEQFLVEQAGKHGIALIGSVATQPREGQGDRPLNMGMIARPDGEVGYYAKIHPFTYGGETEHYGAGSSTLTSIIDGVRVSLLICYDLRFPELFMPLAANTDLFVVIANWPQARREHWRSLLVARSIECLAFVLGVNRVGSGGKLTYSGDSSFIAPGGEVRGSVASGAEAILGGEVSPEDVAELRATFPVLGDRRPDVYRRI